MPTLTDYYASAKTAFEALITESPDRCTVYNRTYANDNAGGTTATDTAVASSIPVIYSEFRFRTGMIVGGSLAEVTHKLRLKDSAATKAIKPNYVIVVAARDNNPARTFENPIVIEETMNVGVVLAATLKL